MKLYWSEIYQLEDDFTFSRSLLFGLKNGNGKKAEKKGSGGKTRLKKFEAICWHVGGVLRNKKHCS